MVVKTKDKRGNEVLMFDPSAVYLNPDELDDSQTRFRIFGQTKLKRAGLKIVQDKYGDDEDYLVYRNGEMEIPMETIDDIVTVRTLPLALTEEQNDKLGQYIEMILGGSKKERAFMKVVECNSFIMTKRTCLLKKGQGLRTGVRRTANAAKESSGRIAQSARKGNGRQKGSRGTKSIATQSRDHSLPITDSTLTVTADR